MFNNLLPVIKLFLATCRDIMQSVIELALVLYYDVTLSAGMIKHYFSF